MVNVSVGRGKISRYYSLVPNGIPRNSITDEANRMVLRDLLLSIEIGLVRESGSIS